MPVIGADDYNTVVDLIADAYNTQPTNITRVLEQYGATNAYDAYKMLENTPYEMLYTLDGNVGAYTYKATSSQIINNAAGSVNSNLQTTAVADLQLPVSTTYQDPTSPISGPKYEVGPRTAPASSSGSTIMGILDKAALGVMGVSLGAKAGAFIAQTFYDAAPYFWDNFLPGMNPETWGSIATTEGGKSFINMIFGIDDDKTTAYAPTDAVAYYMLLMQQQGFFGSGDGSATPPSGYTPPASVVPPIPFTEADGTLHGNQAGNVISTYHILTSSDTVYATIINDGRSGSSDVHFYSKQPFTFNRTSDNGYVGAVKTASSVSYEGQTWYRDTTGLSYVNGELTTIPIFRCTSYNSNNIKACEYIVLFGTQSGGSLPEGITHQPDATLPSLSNNDTVAQTDQKLRTQYPDWYQNPIYLPTQQPDGSIKDVEYIKIPTIPNPDNSDNPTNQTVTQDTDPEVDPDTAPETLIETIFRYLNPNPPETTPPDDGTGDGESPAIITPTGNASSLWSVYNPTQTQVNSFGAWLWSSNFIDQIAKLFLQPMDAIVGIHKVFATPVISGSSTIHCGYLDSGVPSAVVGDQYTYVDCGTVNLYEHFGNVFDYSPFTSVRLYLPFIGIVPIDVADVMRSSINVRYGVDVITGACLAMVKVTRDGGAGGVLYQYGGSCVVHYPHSSGSYMGIVSGVIGLATSAVSALASGGIGAVVGGLNAVSHIGNVHANYQIGGNFSGEPGAMGGKKPYLIISRPQPKVAAAVETFEGYPANYTANLNGARGFVKVLSCHVHTIKNATEDERTEIERHLKEGVVIA